MREWLLLPAWPVSDLLSLHDQPEYVSNVTNECEQSKAADTADVIVSVTLTPTRRQPLKRDRGLRRFASNCIQCDAILLSPTTSYWRQNIAADLGATAWMVLRWNGRLRKVSLAVNQLTAQPCDVQIKQRNQPLKRHRGSLNWHIEQTNTLSNCRLMACRVDSDS